ncbi:MAG: hypothetical protein AB8B99_11795 [Phormidesmis sp.]
MPRLSDRAFHIVKTEIERRYTDHPEDQIERVILLARLEALREKKGVPMTRVQIWEVLSDVAPNFDQNVLMDAESVETDSPFLGVSMGVGAVAVLVATAIGMDSLTPRPSIGQSSPANLAQSGDDSSDVAKRSASQSASQSANQKAATEQGLAQGAKRAAGTTLNVTQAGGDGEGRVANTGASEPADEDPEPLFSKNRLLKNRLPKFSRHSEGDARRNAFHTAKDLGWQAALKSQDPPHSVQHWRETAALWEDALAELDEVSPLSRHYIQAQLKKSVYQDNLKEIRTRQIAAEQLAQQATRAAVQVASSGASSGVSSGASSGASSALATPTAKAAPEFSDQINRSAAGRSAGNSSSAQTVAMQAQVSAAPAAEDPIQVAKRYGWQAAVASQNAPHPPEKWADISRLWQTALSSLNKVAPEDPRYAEAQRVKASYQKNLAAIRDRYQREQTATQRLQSLQASLSELNNSLTPDAVKYGRMEAILEKLRTIPSGTEAHVQAQQLIAETTTALNAIAITPEL